MEEIAAAVKGGVRYVAFSEHRAAGKYAHLFSQVLEGLIERKVKAKFYSLGSIAPDDLIEHRDLPRLMKQAGYAQICFADDRESPADEESRDELICRYAQAASLCQNAGFKLRTDEVIGSVCVGQQGENLAERARFVTRVAHYAGSVIVWPYQPLPDECPDIPLENQNGKLFPLRQYPYRDYLGLMGLATVCNSKYRGRTFDFLGDSLAARLFQASVARRGWDPDPSVKGSVNLPMLKK